MSSCLLCVYRIITTRIRNTTTIIGIDVGGNYKYMSKRDTNDIIQCASRLDKETCIYADKVCAIRQLEYDTAVVYSDRE